jgi:Tfp pilus assembly protein PilF
MVDASIGGTSPWIYHLSNVLYHVASSLLVFLVILRLQGRKSIAAASALLFAVHPLLSSAIAWIPGRNDSLLTLFILLSFLFLLRAIERKRSADHVLHLLFLLSALLTKETAVVFPLLALFYAKFLAKKRLNASHLFLLIAGWTIAVATWYLMRAGIQQGYEVSQSVETTLTRLLTQTPALLLYLGKTLLPFNLAVFPNLMDDSLIWGWLVLGILIFVFFTAKRSNLMVTAWGAAWFILFLLPTVVSGSILHEHRAYTSLVGFLIAVTAFPALKETYFRKTMGVISYGVVLLLFSLISGLHSDNFKDRISHSMNAFVKSPSVDESVLGMAGLYIDHGEEAQAERILAGAILRNPSMKVAHRMLGDVYVKMGKLKEAEQEYITSLTLDPLHLYTYVNYGKMCLEQGRLDDTERLWKKAVEINPDFILGHYLLANFFLHNRNDPGTATVYAQEIEQKGVRVMPELLSRIAYHPKKPAPTGH